MARKKKAKEVPQESSGDRLEDFLSGDLAKALLKKHGANLLTRASDFKLKRLPRISTGILGLDIGLGGGVPVGRLTLIYGHKSTGKSYLAQSILAHAQRMCSSCYGALPGQPGTEGDDPPVTVCSCKEPGAFTAAYIDVEGTWDDEWARATGIDTDRLLLAVPDYAEQSLDIADALVRSGKIDLIVLDSIAFLAPMGEIEGSVEDNQVGLQARIVNKAMRKFVSGLNSMYLEHGKKPTLVFTNQIRQKVGVIYGSPEVIPGGLGQGFAVSVEIRTGGGKIIVDDDGVPLKTELKYKVAKNKTSSMKNEGEYAVMAADTDLKRKGEIYEENVYVKAARKYGFVSGGGSAWKLYGEVYRSLAALEEALISDPNLKAKLRADLMAKVLK